MDKKKKSKGKRKAPKLKLQRVIGLVSSSNATFARNPRTGDVAYVAGCVIVLYSPGKNTQSRFLRTNSTKHISSLAWDSQGRYLAAGESGHKPCVLVWDLENDSNLVSIEAHKYGVNALAFSPNGKYLVSVGAKHDPYLYVWNWREGQALRTAKVDGETHSVVFACDGTFFASAGVRHAKFWYLEHDGSLPPSTERPKWPAPAGIGSPTLIEGRSAALGSRKDAVFVDFAATKTAGIYAVTDKGILVGFGKRRLIERWVDLKSPAQAISANDQYIAVACQNGTVRLFDAKSMEYVATIPKPPAVGEVNVGQSAHITNHILRRSQVKSGGKPLVYPDVVAIRLDASSQYLACLYADRSFFIWDIRRPKHVGKYRSFQSHSGCIWDVEVVPRDRPNRPKSALPPNTFITCSADKSIRFWNIDDKKQPQATDVTASMANFFSRDTLQVLYPSLADDSAANASKEGKDEDERGIRSIALSPDGHVLASGDRGGNLRVHDLRDFSQLSYQQAHDSEILSLSFSGTNQETGKSFLASGGRDRLLHIYNVQRNYEPAQTLAEHSASITAVKFSPQGTHLVSTGADKSIIFRTLNASTGVYKKHHTAYVPHGTVYDLDIDATTRYAATAGQDKRINIYNVKTGKAMRSYNTGQDAQVKNDWPIRVHLDPAGIYMVSCHSDKTIRLIDFYSGDCIANASGHSELITGAKFTADCRHLITVSADGCIFIWKLALSISRTINERLDELYSANTAATTATPPAPTSPLAQTPRRDQVLAAALPDATPPSPGNKSAVPEEEKAKLLSMLDHVQPRPSTGQDGVGLNVRESLMPAWARADGQQQRPATHSGAPPAVTAAASSAKTSSQRPMTSVGGRWAERVGDAGYELYSEAGDLRPLVDPQQPKDWRRFTIEAADEKEFLNARPTPLVMPEEDDDVVYGSDGDDNGISPDDVKIGGLGKLEDDSDTEVVELKTPRDEDIVYFEDEQESARGEAKPFAVAAAPVGATEDAADDQDPTATTTTTTTTTTTAAAITADNSAVVATPSTEDVGQEGPAHKEVDDFLYREFSTLDQEIPRSGNPMRESLTANYMSQILKRSSTVTSSVTSLPSEEDRARESERLRQRQQQMAQEVERTRKRLAELGIVMKSDEKAALAAASPTPTTTAASTTPTTTTTTATSTTTPGGGTGSGAATAAATPSPATPAAKPTALQTDGPTPAPALATPGGMSDVPNQASPRPSPLPTPTAASSSNNTDSTPAVAGATAPTNEQPRTPPVHPSTVVTANGGRLTPSTLSAANPSPLSGRDSEASLNISVSSFGDLENREDLGAQSNSHGNTSTSPNTTTTSTPPGGVIGTVVGASDQNDTDTVQHLQDYAPMLTQFRQHVNDVTTLANEVGQIEATLRALSGSGLGTASVSLKTSVGSVDAAAINDVNNASALKHSVIQELRMAQSKISETLSALGEDSGPGTVVHLSHTATQSGDISIDIGEALDKYSELLIATINKKLGM